MTWILIVGLALWVFLERRAVKALERQVRALETRLRALETRPEAPARKSRAATAVPKTEAPPAPVMAAEAAPAPLLAAPEPALAAAPMLPAPPRPERPKINLAAWLSEHGLAWLGGGALALGGLFLVTYAAQRGVFTPALRIAAAITTGFVMLGAGEWLRRRMTESRRGPAAALLSGAGAATLYGAVWAAHRLYGFIELPAAAPLLAVISAGLLALAFVHGAPLALVALFGAYLAPVVTDGPDWGDGPLTVYLLLILATGYGVAALRGWGHVAWAATAGAVIWALANRSDAQGVPAALLLLASPAFALAAVAWRRTGEIIGKDPLALAPTVALLASALASLALWIDLTAPNSAAAASVGLALVAAVAAGARLTAPMVQAAPYAVAMVGLLGVQFFPEGREYDLTAPGLATVLALLLAGFWAAHRAKDATDRLWAAAGPGLAAVSLCLLTGPLRQSEFTLGWAVPAAAAVICALAAAWLGPRIEARRSDLGLAVWIWSAAVLAARALVAGLEWEGVALGVTVLTLAAAVLHDRIGWRGFGAAAVASGVAALAALVAVGGRAVEEDLAVWIMAAVFAASTLGLWAASRLVRGVEPRSGLSDALSTGAVIAGLMGLFLLLRLRAGVSSAPELEPLLEVGLNVLLLLAAGVMTARGAAPEVGPIARWRPHLFLGLGLIYGLMGPVLMLNPLWDTTARPILGPPLFDSLLVAYLAPAALLAFAARRQISPHRMAAAIYAGGAVLFALAWGVTEIRRLFKGPGFAWGPDVIGRAEGCAYALLLLAAAWGLAWIARRRTGSQIARELDLAATVLKWTALAVSAYVFGYAANPWWGPITRPLADHPSAILLLALHAAGVAGWLAFSRESLFGRAARVTAALQVFVLLTLLIRYGFRGLDMHTALAEARVETWVFSAAWALYGLAVLAYGAVRRDLWLRWTGLILLFATTAKVFLFDMARLDGMIRAASFLAVGALLIVAALAARRFRSGGREAEAPADA